MVERLLEKTASLEDLVRKLEASNEQLIKCVMKSICNVTLLKDQRDLLILIMRLYHVSLESFRNYFAYRGPVLWNALPLSTKKCETLASLKKCLKIKILD